jgi:hypothetical protein
MSGLASIQRGKAIKPPRVMLYGIEGIGKSTWASQAPKPVFVQCEDGLDAIDCERFPLAREFQDVRRSLGSLLDEQHGYETVVLDSLDWLERLVWDQVCQDFSVRNIEKVDGGYGKGYQHAIGFWRELIERLGRLRDERGMAVVLLAHAKVEKFEDPESQPYDRYSPRLHKHAAALVCEWCDAVLFATRRIRTQTEDGGFNRKRTIAQPIGASGGERIVRTVGGPACVAKNRFGITQDLPLAWAAFMNAMST